MLISMFLLCMLAINVASICIPANFFWAKCVRFSSCHDWDFCEFPSDFQRFHMIFRFLNNAENVRRCSGDLWALLQLITIKAIILAHCVTVRTKSPFRKEVLELHYPTLTKTILKCQYLRKPSLKVAFGNGNGAIFENSPKLCTSLFITSQWPRSSRQTNYQVQHPPWNIYFGKSTTPRVCKVTALQVVRTSSFLCPRPCLSPQPHIALKVISCFSKIQLVVYYQCCILIGWATTRLYVIAH